jgi:hypothetical protein
VSRLENALRQAAADLTDCRANFAIIGGVAVSTRIEPRFTRGVDLAVATTTDSDAEHLAHSLLQRGYLMLAQLEHETTGRLAAVRLAAPVDGPQIVVDLMFASSGIEPEIIAAAELLEMVPGLFVRVARIEYLIALKVLARDDKTRPQDIIDLRALLRAAQPTQLNAARSALNLITQRGFNRGKDLIRELNAVLNEQITPP